MGSEQPSKAANGGETPGAGSGSSQSDSKADGAAVGEKGGGSGSESIDSSSGVINLAVPSSGVGGGAVPEVRSQASHVRVVGAVEVVDTGLAEGFARKEEAIAAVDEVEKETNRTADKDRLVVKKKTYAEEFVDDYVTIKNVLDIKDNPVYRTAFEEWNRQLKAWRIKLVDTESEKTDLTTQVYNIVGFFSVFQGVVFTAVSQVSSGSGETCRKTWVPILLSVIAALVTIFSLQTRYGLMTGNKSDITIYRSRITVSLYLLFHIVLDVQYMSFCTFSWPLGHTSSVCMSVR